MEERTSAINICFCEMWYGCRGFNAEIEGFEKSGPLVMNFYFGYLDGVYLSDNVVDSEVNAAFVRELYAYFSILVYVLLGWAFECQ